MSTFERGDKDQVDLLEQAIATWHERLVAADVKVELLVAFGKRSEETGEILVPALKHHGIPALATCKIIPIQQRVLGLGDALVTLDGDRWEDLDEAEQLALLDHELEHIEIVVEARATIAPTPAKGLALVVARVQQVAKRDDAGRPCLRLRPHDHQFGFFDSIARRHGQSSQEVQQSERWADKAGELYFLGPNRARSSR